MAENIELPQELRDFTIRCPLSMEPNADIISLKTNLTMLWRRCHYFRRLIRINPYKRETDMTVITSPIMSIILLYVETDNDAAIQVCDANVLNELIIAFDLLAVRIIHRTTLEKLVTAMESPDDYYKLQDLAREAEFYKPLVETAATRLSPDVLKAHNFLTRYHHEIRDTPELGIVLKTLQGLKDNNLFQDYIVPSKLVAELVWVLHLFNDDIDVFFKKITHQCLEINVTDFVDTKDNFYTRLLYNLGLYMKRFNKVIPSDFQEFYFDRIISTTTKDELKKTSNNSHRRYPGNNVVRKVVSFVSDALNN